MQGKDCNNILPISGCMAATTRPEEASGFIQIWRGCSGECGMLTHPLQGWEEGPLQLLPSWWDSGLPGLGVRLRNERGVVCESRVMSEQLRVRAV